ncbi:MAG: dihydrofolate reductase [Phycisphaerales bacterium]|nr:dihydrofolate reductase [Phycisphaerales bacterium]
MNLSAIVACSENNVIGKNGTLPWHLPSDLIYFKNITWGTPIIMGRKTFEIELKSTPLPGRHHLILTRNKDYNHPRVVAIHNIEQAIAWGKQYFYKNIFIVGGGEIYEALVPYATTLYITRVHTVIDGDTFFEKNDHQWELVSSDKRSADDKNLYDHSFELWKRK